MNERQKKILIFLFLLILVGPFALLWLAFTLNKEEPEVETEIAGVEEEKNVFEWKSIWEEQLPPPEGEDY